MQLIANPLGQFDLVDFIEADDYPFTTGVTKLQNGMRVQFDCVPHPNGYSYAVQMWTVEKGHWQCFFLDEIPEVTTSVAWNLPWNTVNQRLWDRLIRIPEANNADDAMWRWCLDSR